MSSKHVEIVKQELSSPEGFDESLHSASALKELGLIEEAIAQYEKLLTPDCPPEIIIPELTQCLLTTLSPSKVIEQIDAVIRKNNLDDKKIAEVKFILGLEMERGGNKDLAIDQLKIASDLDPANESLKEKKDVNDSKSLFRITIRLSFEYEAGNIRTVAEGSGAFKEGEEEC